MTLTLYLLGINLLTFLLYGWDKRCARHGARRIPEASLLLAGFLGGTVAALFAMRFFRHKTKKGSFLIRFWLMTLLQIGLLLFQPSALRAIFQRILG